MGVKVHSYVFFCGMFLSRTTLKMFWTLKQTYPVFKIRVWWYVFVLLKSIDFWHQSFKRLIHQKGMPYFVRFRMSGVRIQIPKFLIRDVFYLIQMYLKYTECKKLKQKFPIFIKIYYEIIPEVSKIFRLRLIWDCDALFCTIFTDLS